MALSFKNPNSNPTQSTSKSMKHKHSPDETESKRPRASSRMEASVDITTEHWPKFLLIQPQCQGEERDGNPLGKLSPFVVEKVLQGCIGTAAQVRRLRSGDLLV